jgi:hypothetical protein
MWCKWKRTVGKALEDGPDAVRLAAREAALEHDGARSIFFLGAGEATQPNGGSERWNPKLKTMMSLC